MAATGWKRPFANPIPLPGGRQLVTLEDAAGYIMKLPKAEQNLGEWQAAIECLILVAEKNGPTMMARIGMMKALNRHVVREFNPDRKDTHWENGSWRGIDECRFSAAGRYRRDIPAEVSSRGTDQRA
jgi:hypothetical protein